MFSSWYFRHPRYQNTTEGVQLFYLLLQSMARLNLHPPSEHSEIEDPSEAPTVENRSSRDREKEKRKNLSKGNWKLSESQLLQHFGEAVLNSRRQLTKLIAFAKVAPNFTEALPYLKRVQARRQAGTLYRSGISREADWLVTDIIGAMDDFKKEAMAKQRSTKDTLRRKREAPVHKACHHINGWSVFC